MARAVRLGAAFAAVAVLGGCGWTSAGPGCRPVLAAAALPDEVDESSGVAVSRRYPGLYWTVNDSGDPHLYGVTAEGAVRARIRLEGIRRARDWEDLAIADCAEGSCLYVADVGNNYLEQDTLTIFRLPEPDTAGSAPVTPEAFRLLLPDGPRNVEAAFVLPGERLYLVSKGTRHAVTLYRYPGTLRAEEVVTLEEVERLSEGALSLPRQVTGAAVSPDGSTVALRTYETLTFHSFGGERLLPLENGVVSLRSLAESQGEAVGLGPGGEVVLTSEAGPLGSHGQIVVLRCELSGPAGG